MKKLAFVFFFLPSIVCAELISIDLICGGEEVTNCDRDNICDTQHKMERIKIDGNTLVHKTLGNHFLKVDEKEASFIEYDENGEIGFSFNVSRINGTIKIIRGWGKPYSFTGKCEVGRSPVFEK